MKRSRISALLICLLKIRFSLVVRKTDLRSRALEDLADGPLGVAVLVVLGRVDVVHAPVEGGGQDVGVVEGAGPEADVRDLEARPAQGAIFLDPGGGGGGLGGAWAAGLSWPSRAAAGTAPRAVPRKPRRVSDERGFGLFAAMRVMRSSLNKRQTISDTLGEAPALLRLRDFLAPDDRQGFLGSLKGIAQTPWTS